MLRKFGAPENTSAAVGGERSRALIGYRKGGGKPSADEQQLRLRAARSPPPKSASAAHRPSRDASFSEARGVREHSSIPGKKSGSRNSSNINRKIKKIGSRSLRTSNYNIIFT